MSNEDTNKQTKKYYYVIIHNLPAKYLNIRQNGLYKCRTYTQQIHYLKEKTMKMQPLKNRRRQKHLLKKKSYILSCLIDCCFDSNC